MIRKPRWKVMRREKTLGVGGDSCWTRCFRLDLAIKTQGQPIIGVVVDYEEMMIHLFNEVSFVSRWLDSRQSGSNRSTYAVSKRFLQESPSDAVP